MTEFKLNNAPTDGISSVKFGLKSSQYLLVSSWDRHVRLYDIDSNRLKHSYQHAAPVLDCCFTSISQSFSGGLDKTLKFYDFNSQRETICGTHNDAIRCIAYSPVFNLVITGSWDRHIKLWDIRSPGGCVGTFEQPDKVYSMDVCQEKLIVATADRKIKIWNLKNMNAPGASETRESSLKFQTRCVRIFPNKQAYVVCSIEGRAAVEYFDQSPEFQQKKYAFKCHRIKPESGGEIIHPVNAIAFNQSYNSFATGGSDGVVNIWDPFNKKRLCQFHPYSAGITSLAFDTLGTTLAIGSSYNYEKRDMENPPPDQIYIRRVGDSETKPKM